MLHRDYRRVAFAVEEAFELVEQIGVDFGGKRFSLFFELLLLTGQSFRFGVEIGQLLVVSVVATAFAALRSRSESAGRQLAFAGSVVVMAAGAFWFIQRVFFPGGIS